MKELIAGSALVFVGEVKSVAPSGITTELTYPTWEGIVFEWLKVEVEVIEPIKGTQKGQTVRTLMLSTQGLAPIANAPGIVAPKKGQFHLHCLLPTQFENVYASLTAPFDDDQAIFILDRKHWEYGSYRDDPKSIDPASGYGERYRTLWSLVDDNRQITTEGAVALRRRYSEEIGIKPSKDAVIHIHWKKETSENGWQWNTPDQQANQSKP